MGPDVTSNITVHPIWYGSWLPARKRIIYSFLASISAASSPAPSVAGWWSTVRLYTDQTGSNITRFLTLDQEKNDRFYSHGRSLTRLSIQSVIKSPSPPPPARSPSTPAAVSTSSSPPPTSLSRTSAARSAASTTSPSLPSLDTPSLRLGRQLSHPVPRRLRLPLRRPLLHPRPQADQATQRRRWCRWHGDGCRPRAGRARHQPSRERLVRRRGPLLPQEIADLCEGIYGTGGGGSYMGQLRRARDGSTYDLNGLGRRFLVQWVWHPVLNYCYGPNAMDQ